MNKALAPMSRFGQLPRCATIFEILGCKQQHGLQGYYTTEDVVLLIYAV